MEENKNHEKTNGHEDGHKSHDTKKCCGLNCKCSGQGQLIAKIVLAVVIVLALLWVGAAFGSKRGERFESLNQGQGNYFAPGARGGEKAGGCALREAGGCGREVGGTAACAGCANANKQGSGEAGGCQFMRDQILNSQEAQAPGVNVPPTPITNSPVPGGTQSPAAPIQ